MSLLLAVLLAAAPAAAKPAINLTICDDVKDPLTLDPQKEFSEKTHVVVQQLYEGLVRFGTQGDIEPALAVSWQRLDAFRMRFKLREGVRFHNGEPFNAEAVRFSIARYLDPKTGFPALGFISTLEKTEVIDDHTVDIVTKSTDGILLNRLAGFVLMVPPRYLQEKGEHALEENPIGTGAFRFAHWLHGRELAMVRNPDYWNPHYPKADRLVFKFIPDNGLVDALKKGDIDLATELPGTATPEIARVPELKVIKAPSFYTVTASLASDRPPLNDVRVRRALNYALDKEGLIRYDLLGNGLPIATVTMPGEEGHNEELRPYPYDLEKAAKLLAEAGLTKGFTLKTLVKIQAQRAAKIVAAQLKKIGVELEIHLIADADMIAALKTGQWDMFLADCPDPMVHSYFIQSIFIHGKSPFSLERDPVYDGMLEQMVATLDDDKRRELARRLDAYMHDQALLLFLYQRVRNYGMRKNVDFSPPITGVPYFFSVSKGHAPE